MTYSKSFRFLQSGKPEYVIGKSGLIVRGDGEQEVIVSEKLKKLFRETPIPSAEELIPALCLVVIVSNTELGGALDTPAELNAAMAALQNLGLTHAMGAIGGVFQTLRKATAEVAEERKNAPRVLRL